MVGAVNAQVVGEKLLDGGDGAGRVPASPRKLARLFVDEVRSFFRLVR